MQSTTIKIKSTSKNMTKAMKAQLDELQQKEMSRKEFLQQVGSILLIVFGISGLMKAVLPSYAPRRASSSLEYGFNAYGGIKK